MSRPIARSLEIKPVRRDDKIEEWTNSIKVLLRQRDGIRLTDDVAIDYAEKFWRSLELTHVPITEIMQTSGIHAVNWAVVVHSWDLIAATEVNINDTGKPKEDLLSKSQELFIAIGANDGKTSVYSIVNGKVLVKDDEGKLESTAVEAELVIDHGSLRQLVQKAYGNRAKRSSDGALTVRIINLAPKKEEGKA